MGNKFRNVLLRFRNKLGFRGIRALRRAVWMFRILYILLASVLVFDVVVVASTLDLSTGLWVATFLTVMIGGTLLMLLAPVYNWLQRKAERRSIPWTVLSWAIPMLCIAYLIMLP